MKQLTNFILITILSVLVLCYSCEVNRTSSTADKFELSKRGKSQAIIVIANDANEIILDASQELQSHILQATGAKLPIKKVDLADLNDPGLLILVGSSPLTASLNIDVKNLAYEEFIIRITKNRIVLAGRDDMNTTYFYREAGTRLAVYTFLHDYLGIRWYYPGELGTIIPLQKTLYLDTVSKKLRPRFSPRETNLIAGPGLPVTDNDIQRWTRRTRHGGAQLHAGHSFGRQMSKEDFDKHPEYFAMNEAGKRYRDETDYKLVQLCLSNPDLVDIFAGKAKEYFNASVSNQYFTVMPGDAFASTCCKCKSCKAQYDYDTPNIPREMRESRYVWGFVNKVAAKVIQDYPDRMIFCCAYSGYRLPWPGMKFQKNIVNGPTVNRVGFGYQFEDAKKGIEPWIGILNNLIIDENYHHGVIEKKPDGIYVWNGIPRLCPHRIAAEIKQRAEFAIVKGEPYDLYVPDEMVAGKPIRVNRMWMMDNLNLYVIAELNFDPSYDVDRIIDEYCRDLYGPAANDIRNFLILAEKRWTEAPAELDIHGYKEPMTKIIGRMKEVAWTKIFSRENVTELSGMMENAKKCVRGKKNEIYRKRVELMDMSFLQFMLQKQKEGLSIIRLQ